MQSIISKINSFCLEGDFKQAYLLSLEYGKSGCSTCQRMLGWMYYLGVGVEQDESEGLIWMKKSAQSGSAKSLFGLGRLLEDLDEYELAKQVYEESAEKNYLPSKFRLAQIIRHGKVCSANKKLALSLFKEAGGKGHIPSQAARATLLRKGEEGLWGVMIGMLLTVYVFIKIVIYGIFKPYSEKFISSFPMEFNVEMTKRMSKGTLLFKGKKE